MKYCFKCHAEWSGITQPGPRDVCDRCSQDLHACRNCRFLDPSKSNQCQAAVEEPVIDKDRSNFCDEFQFADRPLPGAPAADDGAGNARARFNKLFGK